MFLIADGNNLAWAGFHALRKPMGAETPEQKVRATLLGLTQSVVGLVVRGGEPPSDGPTGSRRLWAQPVTRVAIAFDEGRPLRRRTIYPEYQLGRESQRKPEPDQKLDRSEPRCGLWRKRIYPD